MTTPTNPSPGALDLGRAWNLLADAMHALDALDTPGRSNQMRKDLIHAKIEEAHGIVQRSLAPGAVPDPKLGLRAEILQALKNYRCSKTVDCDGDGLPLLDLLSPGETVSEGLEELRNLAEYLDDKLADCLAPPAQAGASPNDLVTTVPDPKGDQEEEQITFSMLARNVLQTYLEPLGVGRKGMPLHDLAYLITSTLERKASEAELLLRGASVMLDAIEREIPRNDADRDYADTVIQEFRSLRGKLSAAESRINDLEGARAMLSTRRR